MTPRPLSRRHVHSSSRSAPRRRPSLLRRLVRAGAATVAALAGGMLVGAQPAAAGGPTSVLVVNYDQSRASGALTGSTAYENLSRALDAVTQPVGESRPKDSFMSSRLRITWLIHDVSPWRVDAIYLNGTDVWVSTTMSYDGASLFDKPAIWHRPADATLLVDTLTSLGVIGDAPSSAATPRAAASAASAATAVPAARAAQSAQAAQAAQSASPTSGSSSGYPGWLTLLAAVAALGLGFVAGRAQGPVAGRPAAAAERRPGADDRMPPGPAGATASGSAPTFEGGADDPRPSPVGFTPDDGPRQH